MINKITLSLFILLTATISIKAQEIKVFEDHDLSQEEEISIQKHCLKWNMSLIPRGTFLLNHEYSFNNYFSAEYGVGITYRDFIYDNLFRKNDFYMVPNESRESDFGYALEGSIRFYPKEYSSFNGIFIQTGVSYRKYNETYKNIDNKSNTIYGGNKMADYRLLFGKIEETWSSDLIWEFYVGVGVRNIHDEKVKYNEATDIYFLEHTDKNLPQFLLGWKMCFSL